MSVAFHAAQRGVLTGPGPTALSERHDLQGALEATAQSVRHEELDPPNDLVPEIARTFELNRRVVQAVAHAAAGGALPLVLSGNCNACLGAVAGLGAEPLGVIWFDAHADFDTPEDNRSGFFDVFSLAIFTISGWRAQRKSIPGFEEVPEGNVLLIGARDLEPYQLQRVERSAPRRLSTDELRAGSLDDGLATLREQVQSVYLHIDLDVLDPSEGMVNEWAAPGGLTADELDRAVELIAELFTIRAASLTFYDPALDHDGRVGKTAVRIAKTVARVAASPASQPS